MNKLNIYYCPNCKNVGTLLENSDEAKQNLKEQ